MRSKGGGVCVIAKRQMRQAGVSQRKIRRLKEKLARIEHKQAMKAATK
jgi:hypothetical protein